MNKILSALAAFLAVTLLVSVTACTENGDLDPRIGGLLNQVTCLPPGQYVGEATGLIEYSDEQKAIIETWRASNCASEPDEE